MTDEAIAYRLGRAERDIETKADQDDLNGLAAEVRSLRKTLVGLMVTIASSAIVFSFTVLQLLATHKP